MSSNARIARATAVLRDDAHVVRTRVGERLVHVGPGGGGAPLYVVVQRDVPAVGQPQMRVAGAEDADHHQIDRGESEERYHRGVHGFASRGKHLDAGRRAERMAGDGHPQGPEAQRFSVSKTVPAQARQFLVMMRRSSRRGARS